MYILCNFLFNKNLSEINLNKFQNIVNIYILILFKSIDKSLFKSIKYNKFKSIKIIWYRIYLLAKIHKNNSKHSHKISD